MCFFVFLHIFIMIRVRNIMLLYDKLRYERNKVDNCLLQTKIYVYRRRAAQRKPKYNEKSSESKSYRI